MRTGRERRGQGRDKDYRGTWLVTSQGVIYMHEGGRATCSVLPPALVAYSNITVMIKMSRKSGCKAK